MKLDSVLDLKAELVEDPVLPRALTRAVGLRAARDSRVGARLAARLDHVQTRAVDATEMAMGVAAGRRRGDYRLGVRIQVRGSRGRSLGKLVVERARGEADVRFVPRVRRRPAPPAAWFRRRHRPLEPGLSVGHPEVGAGTLGAIVEDTDAYYVFSNNHVLANVNEAEPGHPAAQPGSLDRPISPETIFGVLDRFVPISFTRANLVDCAIAEIFEDVEFYEGWNAAIGGNMKKVLPVTFDDLLRPVTKAGRTTGVTFGRVTQVEVDRLRVDMGDTGHPCIAQFSDQIEIEGENERAFSAPGDSGSLVLDERGHPRALLFSGGEDEQGRDLTYANPILTVLAKLGVTIVH